MTNGCPPPDLIASAILIARRSPCAKSKRGAVVFDAGALPPPDRRIRAVLNDMRDRGLETGSPPRPRVLGAAHNGMPYPFRCGGACGESCAKLCMHAEQRAIRVAEREHDLIAIGTCELIHVKVADGLLVAGGGPSCWQCSRLVVEAGLAAVWLFEQGTGGIAAARWVRYPAIEFQLATARSCNLSGYQLVSD